jgi:integrase
VDDFLASKAIRSAVTARNYKLSLKTFENLVGISPDQAVAKINDGSEDRYKLLERFVARMMEKGQSPKTIWAREAAIRSFLTYSDIDLPTAKVRAKVTKPKKYAITDDRPPTQEELRKLMLEASFGARVVISLLASSGLRRGEAVKLKVRDLTFLGDGRPVKITLPAQITKTGRRRVTFASMEAATILKEYLGTRISQPDSPVFIKIRDGKVSAVRPDALYQIVDRALEKTGLDAKTENGRNILHLHVLRKYFRTQCVLNGVPDGLAAYWMWGTGSQAMDSAYLRAEGQEQYEAVCAKGVFNFIGEYRQAAQIADLKAAIEIRDKTMAKMEQSMDYLVRCRIDQIVKDIADLPINNEGEDEGMTPQMIEEYRQQEKEWQAELDKLRAMLRGL